MPSESGQFRVQHFALRGRDPLPDSLAIGVLEVHVFAMEFCLVRDAVVLTDVLGLPEYAGIGGDPFLTT